VERWDYLAWKLYWWWLFFSAEFFLAIAVWVGLAQRLFPVQRIKVTMDDITSVDDQVGYNARYEGEKREGRVEEGEGEMRRRHTLEDCFS